MKVKKSYSSQLKKIKMLRTLNAIFRHFIYQTLYDFQVKTIALIVVLFLGDHEVLIVKLLHLDLFLETKYTLRQFLAVNELVDK